MTALPVGEFLKDNAGKKETRKRYVFLVKFAIYIAILTLLGIYPGILQDYGIGIHVIQAGLFLLTANLVISLSRILIVFFYIRKKKRHQDFKDNFVLGINQISGLLSGFAVIVSLFILFRISALELYTTLSIVAVAIVLILKEYISNTLNGMVMMFSNQISLNDHIQINDKKGKVINITLKNVVLLNESEDLIFIPNTQVFNSELTNFSKGRVEKVTASFILPLNGCWEMEDLEEFMLQGLNAYAHLVKEGTFKIRPDKIEKDCVKIKTEVVLNKKSRENEKELYFFLNKKAVEFVNKVSAKKADLY